jgi:hypothetical protein
VLFYSKNPQKLIASLPPNFRFLDTAKSTESGFQPRPLGFLDMLDSGFQTQMSSGNQTQRHGTSRIESTLSRLSDTLNTQLNLLSPVTVTR